MPVITAAIDPVTRIEGHLKVEVDIDTVNGVQQVVDARSVGTLFRGFERLLEGRDPRDAPLITSRICGVCPTAHSQASVLMLDQAYATEPTETGRILRNLVHGACFIESDILHFYLLSLPDFIKGPAMAPWLPGWEQGRRIDRRSADRLLGHYLEAITMRRKAHEMGAIFGGKLPHTPAFIPGGFTAEPTSGAKTDFSALLTEIISFIRNVYLPDVELLSSLYRDYFSIGKGYGNLLSFGVFRENVAGSSLLLNRGLVQNGSSQVLAVDPANITEQVTHSWYDESTNDKHPAVGETEPQHPKQDAYSWLKAPRYNGINYECGPIARMTVSGNYSNGVSVLDRHRARAQECLLIAEAMDNWISELPTGQPPYNAQAPVLNESFAGLTEAPRGALGHWIDVEDGKIARYQVVTPTCWNCSPRDSAGQRGPMEEALIGVPVENIDQPIEVLRVIHSFDPCLDCATHVCRPGEEPHRIYGGVNVGGIIKKENA
jgi:hydrogenase large subunit